MSHTAPTLVGNAQLRRQLAGQRLGHAFILSGARGSGRHTLAARLSQTQMCAHTQGGEPCGRCTDCKKALAGLHPDIIRVPVLDEAGKRLSVAEARALHSDAWICPNEGARKIYILEQAGELSETVQNVLLKLIEEGPSYAAFLLLVEHSGQLLGTIRSRCEELKLCPVSVEEGLPFLKEKKPACGEAQLRHALLRSGGILGEALRLLEQEGEESEALSLAESFCRALAAGSEAELAAFMARHEKLPRAQLPALLRGCRAQLHSALRLAAGQETPAPSAVCTALSRLPQGKLLALDALLCEALQRAEGNAGVGILLGWLTVQCAEKIV